MKRISGCSHQISAPVLAIVFAVFGLSSHPDRAAAGVLFEDHFDRGIPGWTAVQPAGTYISGPMLWYYDPFRGGFVENSNIYTDDAAFSTTATAVMLINDAEIFDELVYTVTLNAGDDDGFGLVFGYLDEGNFYRVAFGTQDRFNPDTGYGFPGTGWRVDRKHPDGPAETGNTTVLFGNGSEGFTPDDQTFLVTRGQPFTVTVQVDLDNNLTLTVVENSGDPGAAVTHVLVDGEPLPAATAGRVGLFSWGMNGGNPPGFLASDLSLSPIPLENPEPDLIGDWTPVSLATRADGSNALNLPGSWGVPVGEGNLPYNGLVETSNGLGGNDAPGQVDFVSATLVAGATSWRDYAMTTRMVPGDDDGFGVIVRYQDPANFYRIAFRQQSSGSGVQQGISVQKAVDGVYEQVFHDNAKFIPSSGRAFELTVTVDGDMLSMNIVDDPDGEALPIEYDPIQLAGETLDHGKIGLFSWAMGRMLFDSVRVDGLSANEALLEDDFNRPLVGWTSVQPAGAAISGPLMWFYDEVTGGFSENSNIYYDDAGFSATATAVMLINDAEAGDEFVYSGRLVAGDDDGFGLIFGYQDEQNFYRATFARQNRSAAGYPWFGWHVDRKTDGVVEPLFGSGTPDHVDTFAVQDNVPFDVTISVGPDNALSLLVVNNPDDPMSREEFQLVDAQTLPSSAAGQVGVFSWGMSGGAPPAAFLIDGLNLEPGALVNPAPDMLRDWQYAVPVARFDNSNALNYPSNWGFPVGADNVSYGTLVESSNNLGGNDAGGQVDFVAGSVVAGASSWTDYAMVTRIIPFDDDGFGVLLRYQNPSNFYRIAFRQQASGTGVQQGVSVQQVVDGFYEEVFIDPDLTFVPVSGTPFDVSAFIIGNELNIRVVNDPDGAADTFEFGPITFLEPTLPSGKVGLWSWGMGRVDFDSVRVDDLAGGISLQVSAAFGSPVPEVGTHVFEEGTEVTATADPIVQDLPGVRRVLTGWTGSGSVPESGVDATVTFVLDSLSSIAWSYSNEFELTVSSSPGGVVNGPDPGWIPESTGPDDLLTFDAVANTGFVFDRWAGATASANPSISLAATRPIALTAHFSEDSDEDGLADDWERKHFNDLSAGPGEDPDEDGVDNLGEQRRGTDPLGAEIAAGEGSLIPSDWVNPQRDPILSGQWIINDFGEGYRGPWDNSNDHRGADLTGGPAPFFPEELIVPSVSFEGPRMIVSQEAWNPDWVDFILETAIVVGDNDGNCVYFRYQDENNWYRVSINGPETGTWRPPVGLSVQKKEDGVYSELAQDLRIGTDPANDSANFRYKQVRITVEATGGDFVVRAIGWELSTEFLPSAPDYDPFSEVILEFSDPAHASGRVGIGSWGQSGGSAVPMIPVSSGVMFKDFSVRVGDETVFADDWTTAPLGPDLPEGWENPFADGPLAGNWQASAHGAVLQLSNALTGTTGTLVDPRADGEGPVLLAPAPGSSQYFLELGIHPFDNDGIGFVYDYIDPDHYAKVVFANQATSAGGMPRGVNVSRKTAGTWTDLIVQDEGYVYEPGRPFGVQFSNNNGEFRMTVVDLDDPAQSASFVWSDQAAADDNRFGLHAWGATDSHFLYARVSELGSVVSLEITGARIEGAQLVLDIANPDDGPFDVDVTDDVIGGTWTPVATGQSGNQWSVNIDTLANPSYFRLRKN